MTSLTLFCWVIVLASAVTVFIWLTVVWFVVLLLLECARDAWRWWRKA